MFPTFEKFTLMKQTETTTSDSTGNNTLLAVSGLTAIDFLRQEVKKYKPFTPNGLNQLPYALYEAVAQAMENYRAACASGAVDTATEGGMYCVSSEALVNGNPCKEWCGDKNCWREAPSGSF